MGINTHNASVYERLYCALELLLRFQEDYSASFSAITKLISTNTSFIEGLVSAQGNCRFRHLLLTTVIPEKLWDTVNVKYPLSSNGINSLNLST